MMPSKKWLAAHPGKSLNDYVQAMQESSPSEKQERFLNAMDPRRPKGYFKWLRTGDNWYVVAIWGLLAFVPLFGLLCVAWSIWTEK